MAHSMVLYMYKLMGDVLPVSDEVSQAMVDECARSFSLALAEVVGFARTLAQTSCFKVGADLLASALTHADDISV